MELKARCIDPGKVRSILIEVGATFDRVERQVDTYFKVPAGRLKLREITGQGSELIFYRRNESGTRRDCSYEIARHPDPSALKAVLALALGVDVVVAKTREVYWFGNVKINLDDVDGLGRFVEFEVPVEAADFEEADSKIKYLAIHLRIDPRDVLPNSYSDMVRTIR